jgi:hypothetical protein
MADDDKNPPQLVEQFQKVEIGPAIRTETPDGDEAGSERMIRDRHDARRDVMNATRDYDNGSIDHEELDRTIANSRYKLEKDKFDSPMERQPKPI